MFFLLSKIFLAAARKSYKMLFCPLSPTSWEPELLVVFSFLQPTQVFFPFLFFDSSLCGLPHFCVLFHKIYFADFAFGCFLFSATNSAICSLRIFLIYPPSTAPFSVISIFVIDFFDLFLIVLFDQLSNYENV